MSAIDRALGYYRMGFGEDVWWLRAKADVDLARRKGRLVLSDDVVLISWPVVCGNEDVAMEALYVHLAVGDLAALADVDVPWRWLCWQRGLRSERWHWARSARVLERLRGMKRG